MVHNLRKLALVTVRPHHSTWLSTSTTGRMTHLALSMMRLSAADIGRWDTIDALRRMRMRGMMRVYHTTVSWTSTTTRRRWSAMRPLPRCAARSFKKRGKFEAHLLPVYRTTPNRTGPLRTRKITNLIDRMPGQPRHCHCRRAMRIRVVPRKWLSG